MLRRTLSPWLILLLALTVVLVIDPWAVLAVGFWFSVLSPSCRGYVSAGWSRRWPTVVVHIVLATQAAVTLGLAPLFAGVVPTGASPGRTVGECGGDSAGDDAGGTAHLCCGSSCRWMPCYWLHIS